MRYTDAYRNAAYIPGGDGWYPRWQADAAAFRGHLAARLKTDLRYGEAAGEWFDLALPEGDAAGLLVFVHGGYWLECGPRDFSHLAAGALARGWAVAMPAYPLAPSARISQMTAGIARALPVMADEVAGPVVLAGHSAGGHLVARMASVDVALDDQLWRRLRRIVPISPLADLRPLLETDMAADLRLDLAEAWAESPVLRPVRSGLRAHVWVGADERPAFRDQARRLGNAWACPVTREPGRHHFDVIDGLARADSPLVEALLGTGGI